MNGLKQTNCHPTQKNQFFPCTTKVLRRITCPLAFPMLRIESINVKGKASIKFVVILFDENLTWKDHINTMDNKISKNIGLISNIKCVRQNHITNYIHYYLNYAKSWDSTDKAKLIQLKHLKQIHLKQKHDICLICNENKFMYTTLLMWFLHAECFSNNIQKIIVFMYMIFLQMNLPILPKDI